MFECMARCRVEILHRLLLHNQPCGDCLGGSEAKVAADTPREGTCLTAHRVPSWPCVHLQHFIELTLVKMDLRYCSVTNACLDRHQERLGIVSLKLATQLVSFYSESDDPIGSNAGR